MTSRSRAPDGGFAVGAGMALSETGSTAAVTAELSPMDIYEEDGDRTNSEKRLSSAEDASVAFS